MKFYKTISKTFLAALAAMTAFSCQDMTGQDEEDVPQLNDALELAVDVEDITATSAKIKVTHNGDKSDTWYGFLTEDVTSDEEVLINSAVSDYMNGDSDEGLRKSKNYVTVLKDLAPDTDYRYVAFGLTADGQVYGTSASMEFTTDKSSSGGQNPGQDPDDDTGTDTPQGMKVNPSWTVNYIGEGVIEGQEYEHVVTVNSTDRNTYTITVVPSSLWNVNMLYEETELLIDDMITFINEYNSYYGTSYTLADLLFTGTASDAFDLYPGYYVAVAVGITTTGKVSGHYAVSEVFEVKEAVPTDEYKSWLGDWNVVGQNGAECTVTLSRHETNRSFWMYGWEGFEDIPVDVEYSQDRNDLTFYAQKVADNYQLDEEVYADMYFFGVDDEGYFYTIGEDEYYYIAIAGILDDGQRALVRYGVNVTDYPTFVSMSYAAEIDGEYYFFTEEDEVPSFRGIAGIYPVSKTSAFEAEISSGRMLQTSRLLEYSLPRPRIMYLGSERKAVLR